MANPFVCGGYMTWSKTFFAEKLPHVWHATLYFSCPARLPFALPNRLAFVCESMFADTLLEPLLPSLCPYTMVCTGAGHKRGLVDM